VTTIQAPSPGRHPDRAAGGNHPQACTDSERTFFDLPRDALEFVLDLNLVGTILACQVFGRQMAGRGAGSILNVSSMNAFTPLTRIPAYSAAKAGVSNFTQWLAVYMAQEYGPGICVNAVAPGFFLTKQNRFLLTDELTGSLPRATFRSSPTHLARLGKPEDLLGTVLWLLSPALEFVTGTVIPVDGGFSASGVWPGRPISLNPSLIHRSWTPRRPADAGPWPAGGTAARRSWC
jgi:NAD(P)-dependent dehydrogenase (short-subunit alcohol dehydrogenase family)